MAYLQARANIARSGVTYCGWTPPNAQATIAGTNRTALMLRDGWTLTARADGTPSTFSFSIHGVTPTVGQDVKVAFATPNDYLFGGTILQRRAEPSTDRSADVVWHCTAVGYQWLLDRYDVVLAQYVSTGVGTIVGDILYRFTDGGFRVGYIPSSLGNLSMEFTFETVWTALKRIAKACGGVLELTPDRIVNIYTSYPEAALATVTQASILHKSLTYDEDLTQVRTRSLFEGQQTTTAAPASAGATTISVNETGIFSSTGGSVVSGRNLVTYSGLSTSSGAGTLTGVSGILYDIATGDEIKIIVDDEDAAAQTALATILGGGLSGQVTNYMQDGRLSLSEATARAAEDLSTFGGSLEDVSWTYGRHTATASAPIYQRYVRAGRSVVLDVTSPITVSGTFTIQSVTLTPWGDVGGANFKVFQRITANGFTRTLADLLRQLRG